MKKIFLFLFPLFAFIYFNISASAAVAPNGNTYDHFLTWRSDVWNVTRSFYWNDISGYPTILQFQPSNANSLRFVYYDGSLKFVAPSVYNAPNYYVEFNNGSSSPSYNGFNFDPNNAYVVDGDCALYNANSYPGQDASVIAYFTKGDTSAMFYVSAPPISFDPFDYEYDSAIPTPNLTMDSSYRISFENGTSDLYVVAYTRWKSYLNFNIYRDISDLTNDIFHPIQTINTYYYSGDTFTSNLYEVISVEDGLWSRMGFDLYGNYPNDPSEISNSFAQFITDYPVANRIFTFENGDINGSLVPNNAIKLSTELKQALAFPNSALNSPEVYFRYYILDSDGVPHFGKWAKLTIPLGSNNYSTNTDLIYGTENKNDFTVSTNGIDNNSVIDGDNSGDNITINPTTGSPVIDWNINSPNFNTGIQNFRQALGLFGTFQQFVALVYSMLPPWMIALMGSTITMLCGLAVYHGIRG